MKQTKRELLIAAIFPLAVIVTAGCGNDDKANTGDAGDNTADSGSDSATSSDAAMDSDPNPAADAGMDGDQDATSDANGDGAYPTPVELDDSGTSKIDIVGSYTDTYGTSHTITESMWTQNMDGGVSVFHITQYSNDERFLVAQADPANAYNPNLWSRFDWTEKEDKLYYCQSIYDASTEDAALKAKPADSTDLDKGCAGFSWSELNQ
jgi:hypothetical protein